MEAQKQDQIRHHESAVQRPPFAGTQLYPRASGEHGEQAIILSAVVPRAPCQINCENPGERAEPGMRYQQREHDQRRDVHREDTILLEIFGAVIGAIQSRHVVRIVEEECEGIECHRPQTRTRS